MIRVAVAGVKGRMGSLAADAVRSADDLQYVGGFARNRDGDSKTFDDLQHLLEDAKPDVLVDFTTHPETIEVATQSIVHGVSPVIGATGWSKNDVETLRALAHEHQIGAMLVPNFALGAALMMRFSEEAARYFPSVEILELHHDQKKDKPSGTARLTADRLSALMNREVPVHSVRLRGLLAHQAVMFGNSGETLTIRHDSLSRESYVGGILFAIRAVRKLHSLEVGLDALLVRT
ncbi:MAG: 4-hydroxy-tetrahydrodipicolinate reductase [Candidatus Eremiobacteraeota bacterium]|nr:4-hydroxy-tetrahydrodipicolinate reductase [Candidatus Eremiobacteraeota bacterium]